jgi:predicted ATP-grasp superfamily ATP-dependent carboligase
MAVVLVTDGEERASLAAVRSLGAAGHQVHVVGSRRRTLAGASRFAASSAVAPQPLREPGAFLKALEGLVRERAIEVVIPVTEAALLAVLPERHQLGDAVLPFPSAEAFRRISDKVLVLEVARDLGIRVPEQYVLVSPEERDLLDAQCLEYPLVVKPSRSVAPSGSGAVQLTVRHATDRGEFEAIVDALPAAAFPLLLQQRVRGPGAGIFLLVWEGQTLAAFAHRRIREKPPAGGVSVYRESIPLEEALLERSQALLDRFEWKGVAMVEFKIDAATGTPYLMEVNGRLWGSLQLAVDAGVDFPVLLVEAALGRPVPQTAEYRIGVRSRWWYGDLDQLLARLRHGPSTPGLDAAGHIRWRALREFLSTSKADINEILRVQDPLPFLRESIDWLRGR